MSRIEKAVRQACKCVEDRRDTFAKDEAATRSRIIEPLFDALGWDVQDISRVKIRKGQSAEIPDYTLYADARPIIQVEAKPVGSRIAKAEISRLLKYCEKRGSRFGALTTGVRWQVFKPNRSGAWSQGAALIEIDLENGDADRAVESLKLLSPDEIEQLELLARKRSALDKEWATLVADGEAGASAGQRLLKRIKSASPEVEVTRDEIEKFVKSRAADEPSPPPPTKTETTKKPSARKAPTPKKTTKPPATGWSDYREQLLRLLDERAAEEDLIEKIVEQAVETGSGGPDRRATRRVFVGNREVGPRWLIRVLADAVGLPRPDDQCRREFNSNKAEAVARALGLSATP